MTVDYVANADVFSDTDQGLMDALIGNFVDEVYSSLAEDEPRTADHFPAADMQRDQVAYL